LPEVLEAGDVAVRRHDRLRVVAGLLALLCHDGRDRGELRAVVGRGDVGESRERGDVDLAGDGGLDERGVVGRLVVLDALAGDLGDVVHERLVVRLGVHRVGDDAENEGVLVDGESAGGLRVAGGVGGIGRSGAGGEAEREDRSAGEGGESTELHEDLSGWEE